MTIHPVPRWVIWNGSLSIVPSLYWLMSSTAYSKMPSGESLMKDCSSIAFMSAFRWLKYRRQYLPLSAARKALSCFAWSTMFSVMSLPVYRGYVENTHNAAKKLTIMLGCVTHDDAVG